MTTISRLKAPFESNCMDSYNWRNMSGIAFLEVFEYSSKNCKSWCYLLIIMEQCKCFAKNLIEGLFVKEFIGWQRYYNFTFCQEEQGSNDSTCVKNLIDWYDQASVSYTHLTLPTKA